MDASIDVYFDAAGTVKQLDGVAPGTEVDIYVVAHGVIEPIIAFSFALESSQGFVAASSSSIVSSANHELYQNSEGIGRFARNVSTGSCLEPVDGTVMLLQCKIYYAGSPNCTIGVTNFLSCDRPSEFPSYMSCLDTCRWRYFTPKIECHTVINPEDIGDDGVDDTCTCRTYRIVGDSDGIGWTMALRIPDVFPDSWYLHTEHPGLTSGAPASAFATVIADWLNTLPRINPGISTAPATPSMSADPMTSNLASHRFRLLPYAGSRRMRVAHSIPSSRRSAPSRRSCPTCSRSGWATIPTRSIPVR